ncbi:MAG: hypothetical protein LQ350_008310, partial [Teloschistes chrysophthalmus]
ASIADTLWAENQDLVSQFLNNDFINFCGRGSDEVCLPLYRKYYVQDYFYLVDYVKYKAHRLITIPTGELSALRNEADSVSRDAKYTITANEPYVKDLHGRAEDLAKGNRSIAELAYGNVFQNAASYENWYNLHVISIPCIYGWTRLTQQLMNNPSTRNAFLNANEAVWKNGIDTGTPGRVGEWTSLFRTAMRLEIALFVSAFEK